MNSCTICKRELPTSLDEYGPAQKPVCQECFLDPAKNITPDEERIEELEGEIEEMGEEVEGLEYQIHNLQKEIDRKADELQEVRCNGQKVVITPAMLHAWTAGLPKVVA